MRMRLKKSRGICFRKWVIVLPVLVFVCYVLGVISRNVSYYYLNYSEKKAKDVIDVAMESGLSSESLNILKDRDLYKVTRNSSNEIIMIDYDSYLVNLFLRDVSNNISNALRDEEGDVSFYVPLGSVFKNPIINGKGPKIPVRMELLGSVTTNIETKVTEYGINNSLIEMSICVVVKEKVVLPVISNTIKVENSYPISYKVITGKVPVYYGKGISKSSGIYSFDD